MEPTTGLSVPYIIPAKRHAFFAVIHQLLPASSGARREPDLQTIDGQAEFQIHKRAAVYANGQAKVQFQLSNDKMEPDVPVFISSIGSGQFPTVLPSPLTIGRGNQYRMYVDDRQSTQATNNLRIIHLGMRVYQRPFERRKEYARATPYPIVCNFTADDGGAGTLAASESRQTSVVIPGEWDYEIRKLVMIADYDFSFNVMLSGKGRNWFSRKCYAGLLGASNVNAAITSGSWPFILPVPEWIAANGAIQFDVTNEDSTNANRIQIVLLGNRLEPPDRVS